MTDAEFEGAKNMAHGIIANFINSLERLPTETDFNDFATRTKDMLKYGGYNISDDDFEKIRRSVRAKVTVEMDGEDIEIVDGKEHKKWLDDIKSKVDWFFWTRYEDYLLQIKHWPQNLVTALNTTSDKILDYMGNPNSTENFNRRGLIIGEVQSGKTATYTALCNKAADVGYKIIIVLTGTLEDLRRQTQERLDLEFAGRESQSFLSKDNAVRNKPVGVAIYAQGKSIPQFTSDISDFRAAILDNLKLGLDNLNGTVLFVVKKNKSILENLINWLKRYSVQFGAKKINQSLLLLDDEADNASINTHGDNEDPTAINNCIRELLKLFSRTTYVGVTATPFANIFIMPFNEDGMLNDDLFPKDFIYALDVPSNYIGVNTIFGDKYKNFLVPIEPRDYPDVEFYFPKRHRVNLLVKGLPESLCEAMDYFLLANVIRDLRGDKTEHRTMLIHVSRFTKVHEQIYDLVSVRLDKIVRALRAYAAYPVAEAERESTYIKNLRKVFDKYKLKEIGGVSWEEILHDHLRRAVEPLKVGLRNSSGKAAFSYEENKDNGLRIIAIGGNSFTRGLTLEGLCVTYFYRNSKFYDTLMQMGRWFGYRPNYDDLCKLWTSQEIIDWYRYVAKVSNELKQEIVRMERYGKTPQDFGLKVRRHPEALEITARNKMRYGTGVERPVELNRIFLETPRLKNDKKSSYANAALIRKFVDALAKFTKQEDTRLNLWRDVPKSLVAQLVLNFDSVNWVKYQARPISEYIDKLAADYWDVFIPEGDGELYDGLTIGGEKFTFKPVERAVSVKDDEIRIGGANLQVGTPSTTKAGLTADEINRAEDAFRKLKKGKYMSENVYLIYGRRPLLVIFAIRPKIDDAKNIPELLFALGVGFPALDPKISESKIATATFVVNQIGYEEDIEE